MFFYWKNNIVHFSNVGKAIRFASGIKYSSALKKKKILENVCKLLKVPK